MFENLHKTKAYAFLDGFLCGLVTYYIGGIIRKEVVEYNDRQRAIALFPGSQK